MYTVPETVVLVPPGQLTCLSASPLRTSVTGAGVVLESSGVLPASRSGPLEVELSVTDGGIVRGVTTIGSTGAAPGSVLAAGSVLPSTTGGPALLPPPGLQASAVLAIAQSSDTDRHEPAHGFEKVQDTIRQLLVLPMIQASR